jgi:hypothetical protein
MARKSPTRRARTRPLDRLDSFEDDCVLVVIETPKGSAALASERSAHLFSDPSAFTEGGADWRPSMVNESPPARPSRRELTTGQPAVDITLVPASKTSDT